MVRLLACALAGALLFLTPLSADAAKAKKKAKPIKGTVVEVKGETLTIRTVPAKKQTGAKPVEKVFKLTSATKVEKVSGKKTEQKVTPAAVSDLAKNQTVTVSHKGETATVVKISKAKKKKTTT